MIADKLDAAQMMTALWNPLTDEQRQQLAEQLEICYVERNDRLYRVGDTVSYLMYLCSGIVLIYRPLKDKDSHFSQLVSPGSMFGYQAAFSDGVYHHNAIAGDRAKVVLVPIELVFHFIWENSGFAMVFIKELSNLLEVSEQYMVNVTKKHIRGRLAISLLRMKEKCGVQPDGQTLAFYLSRRDLASMSNMTTSNAIRTLSSFASEGLIALAGRTIKILDEEGLNRVARLC